MPINAFVVEVDLPYPRHPAVHPRHPRRQFVDARPPSSRLRGAMMATCRRAGSADAPDATAEVTHPAIEMVVLLAVLGRLGAGLEPFVARDRTPFLREEAGLDIDQLARHPRRRAPPGGVLVLLPAVAVELRPRGRG